MIKLALVGKSIQHSKSQQIYEKLLHKKINYTLLDYQDEKLIPPAIELLEKFDGISITSPYKLHFLSQLSTNLSPVVGVNTLRVSNNQIEGQNTDFLAVSEILKNFYKNDFSDTFVLGDGVMADLTVRILKDLKVEFCQFSRKMGNMNKLNDTINSPTLIINTCAREYCYEGNLSELVTFWDMNYNLEQHCQLFQNTSIKYVDGIELLELQAKYALSFWNLNTH